MDDIITACVLLVGILIGYVLGRLSDKRIICVPQGAYELTTGREQQRPVAGPVKNPFNDAVRRYFYPKPKTITIQE